MDEHDRHSLGRPGALHAVCMRRRVAAHIAPSPTDGGVGRVHVVLQHWFWSDGACVDHLVCRLVAICCSLSCCWAMLRSSEVRLRLLSVRHGLVVTEVRCGGSVSVTIVGASCRGGEVNGVYAGGEEEAESCVSVICGSAWCSFANGRSMCWRAAAWYSGQVRGRCVRMFSARRM